MSDVDFFDGATVKTEEEYYGRDTRDVHGVAEGRADGPCRCRHHVQDLGATGEFEVGDVRCIGELLANITTKVPSLCHGESHRRLPRPHPRHRFRNKQKVDLCVRREPYGVELVVLLAHFR